MRIITAVALAIAVAAPSVSAAKGGKPWGNPRGPDLPGQSGYPGGPPRRANFISNDRFVIQQYYTGAFARGACPPGLAKKHSGCLPPGQARHWVIGQPLPIGVVWYAVPRDLLVRLSPPPIGFRYVYLDGAVLLFNPATRVVADGVSININIR